jgi:hypothetical protein
VALAIAGHLNVLIIRELCVSDGKELVTSKQLNLDLCIEKEVEINGIGMGVLSDGTPYLTGRGLARVCGIVQNAIVELTNSWPHVPSRPREAKIKEILRKQELAFDAPFIPIERDGITHYAYPDSVCMAVLEYYAFEAGANCKPQAQHNYRLLARNTFREFIYRQVGYDPRQAIERIWRQFHDRVALVYDSAPHGYFSIFKETSDIIVTLIRSGANIGGAFVPDISIGQHWATYWRDNNLADLHGDRGQYEHNYPDYFPQSPSNPQLAYCYPDSALPTFRRWIREIYLANKFPAYLHSKTRQGALPSPVSAIAVAAIEESQRRRALPPRR